MCGRVRERVCARVHARVHVYARVRVPVCVSVCVRVLARVCVTHVCDVKKESRSLIQGRDMTQGEKMGERKNG